MRTIRNLNSENSFPKAYSFNNPKCEKLYNRMIRGWVKSFRDNIFPNIPAQKFPAVQLGDGIV
jgi:hypothetical protein